MLDALSHVLTLTPMWGFNYVRSLWASGLHRTCPDTGTTGDVIGELENHYNEKEA